MTIRNRTERGPPDGLHVRAVTFLPARAAYVAQVVERLGIDPSASRAIVVGAGRGLLARELTRLGFTVVALDPDADAVRLDEEASARDGLPGDYGVGDARHLRFDHDTVNVAHPPRRDARRAQQANPRSPTSGSPHLSPDRLADAAD